MITDISEWPQGQQRWVPIGKRIKNVVHHPKTYELYYFKEPKEKYPWEFWTEIIAYKIGRELGFNTLEYVPAIMKGIGGSLSPSMAKEPTQDLIHGQQYLIRIYPEFELKKGTDHTFQLCEAFFKSDERATHLMKDFIEMLVFDAVIGNRDRHQQNWAVIREVKLIKKPFFSSSRKVLPPMFEIVVSFSELFDNGNCLAYNITEESIDEFLADGEKLNKYLFGPKATSHVRWFGTSLTHIDLLKKIHGNYPEIVNSAVEMVRQKYSKNKIEDIVMTIDKDSIFANQNYNLSTKRKELICKLIRLRIERLLSSL